MINTAIGKPYPLGSTFSRPQTGSHQGEAGWNFAIFSACAENVKLCLFFDGQELPLEMYQTGDIWHLWVGDLPYGTEYGFRLKGKAGTLCNPQKLMLDPYAKAVIGKPDLSSVEKREWFLLSDSRDNASLAPKAVLIDEHFDWQGDKPLATPWAETLIYELHIKGFTQLRQDLPEAIRGTYAGLAHPTMIAYLKALGISAVEILPINYHLNEPHLQEKSLTNYWGYSPLAMFAVESDYWSGQAGTTPLSEFKTMVKTLHQAGIEVILDVVFNHSVESEKTFPTFSQRGIDDRTYYWQNAQGEYLNATGCGNTLNLANDITRRWVIDCLRYWVEECHIDGFRFDLATVLGRETPDFNPQARLFIEIAQEPRLQHCKFIAEPWDIGEGGYQVGNFPPYFAEWNDRFRDDMCRFWLWKSGELGGFAQRFAGSSDIYQNGDRKPHNSVNFITAHDGFTLCDLTSYNQKHNLANGEDNRDGRNENYSYNHGIEGVENIPDDVKYQRFLTCCGLLGSLLLANGTPMLLAGDEFGHSQQGNNNAYCQDNEITWLNWQKFQPHLFEATKQFIALRKAIPSLQRDEWWSEKNVQWRNVQGEIMTVADWHNPHSKAMQIQLDEDWLLLINAKAELQTFLLPEGKWEVVYCGASVQMQGNRWAVNDLAFVCCTKKKGNDY
ncbi:glycogen debranching protein GlgX [Avibacterium paragallinarum]|uniref:glycogen debranching protein GlgX n=1 Tax=Avibacterium paragallinarum TaxID=728 RepID=UPI00397D5B5E